MAITEMRPLFSQLDGVHIRMSPLMFRQKGDELLISTKGFNSTQEHALGFCFLAMTNQHCLVRCGSLDTRFKVDCLKRALDKVLPEQNRRIVINHLGQPKEAWEEMLKLYHATNSEVNIHVLNFPTELFYYKPQDEKDKEFEQKTYQPLTQQYNVETWIQYCQWIGEEIQAFLKTLKVEQTDEFRLQASMEAFVHELKSDLLAKQKELLSAKPNLLSENEKEWIAIHLELQTYLQNQYEALRTIFENISVIEKEHPELLAIKSKVWLLMELLKDHFSQHLAWDKRLLYLHLLDFRLGITPVMTHSSGLSELHFPFAMRMALNTLSLQYPASLMDSLVMNWDQIQWLAAEKYPQGIGSKQFPKDQGKQLAYLITILRNRFWDYLRGFCLPIMTLFYKEARSHAYGAPWHERKEMLSFIPYFDESFYHKTTHSNRLLVSLDTSSRIVEGLTDNAHHLLSRIF